MRIFTLSIVAVSVWGCSDDDDSSSIADKINTPNSTGSSKLVSVTRMGSFEKEYAWTFVYNKSNMTKATSMVQEGLAGNLSGSTVTYNISYATRSVSVNTSGLSVSLSMNGGLVAAATSGNTTYNYSYTNGCLTSWNVTYTNTGFDNVTTKGASAKISWGIDGNIYQIVYTPSSDAPEAYYTYTLTYYDDRNSNGLLLEGLSEMLGCKGSEYLYYSGMLGYGTQNRLKHVDVVYSKDDTYSNSYDFTYSVNNGNVTVCTYGASLDEVVIVNYTY